MTAHILFYSSLKFPVLVFSKIHAEPPEQQQPRTNICFISVSAWLSPSQAPANSRASFASALSHGIRADNFAAPKVGKSDSCLWKWSARWLQVKSYNIVSWELTTCFTFFLPFWLCLLVISHMAPLVPVQHRPWLVQGQIFLKAQSTGAEVQSSSCQTVSSREMLFDRILN